MNMNSAARGVVLALAFASRIYAQQHFEIAGARFAMVAYNWDGSLDTSFGVNGKVVTVFPGTQSAGMPAAILDSQQRIIVAGSVDNKVTVTRYLINGALDLSFHGTGAVITNLGYPWARFHALTIDQSDRILFSVIAPRQVIQGETWHTIILARLNPDGSFDQTFGQDPNTPGIVPTVYTSEDPGAIAISGGFIYVTSSAPLDVQEVDHVFTCFRHLTDGQLAPFPATGLNAVWGNALPGPSVETPRGLAIDSKGGIFLAGTESAPANGIPRNWVLYHFTSNGLPDLSFSPTGFHFGTFNGTINTNADGNAMAVDALGNIVIAGSQFTGSATSFGAARIRADGDSDLTFSSDGLVTTSFGLIAEAHAVTTSEGKVVAAGWTANFGSASFALARYNSDGTLDTSLNGTGKVVTQVACHGGSKANAIAAQRVVVMPPGSHLGFIYTRILTVGTSDSDACP